MDFAALAQGLFNIAIIARSAVVISPSLIGRGRVVVLVVAARAVAVMIVGAFTTPLGAAADSPGILCHPLFSICCPIWTTRPQDLAPCLGHAYR